MEEEVEVEAEKPDAQLKEEKKVMSGKVKLVLLSFFTFFLLGFNLSCFIFTNLIQCQMKRRQSFNSFTAFQQKVYRISTY